MESVDSKSDKVLKGQTGLIDGQKRTIEALVETDNKIKSGNYIKNQNIMAI